MNISFEDIGMWCATCACDGVSEGAVVKLSAGGTVKACDAGEAFCGVVRCVEHDGAACSVQLGGLVKVSYSGAAPAVGFAKLSADGTGGVKIDEGGRELLVMDVDTGKRTVVIKL